MKVATPLLFLFTSASAFAPAPKSPRSSVAVSETREDLKTLSETLNPVVKFYDPTNLAEQDFYGMGEDATVGFLRHAEIKHGRVAMAAFVGYCVQSNFHFPWPMTLAGDSFPSIDLSPEAQWDAIPTEAKWQIILLAGFLEFWEETVGLRGGKHYMLGGRPGDYPSFQPFRDDVHFILDLYDPFGSNKKMSEEKKSTRLAMEINNGRLAMLGIFGFVSADVVPGSVPALTNIATQYDGNIMSPFESTGSFLGL